jgi:hypothetical protein
MSKQHVPAPITLNEAIDGIRNSISTIFSKDDVLNLLNRIEVKVTEPEFTEHEMEELIDHVRSGLAYLDSTDVVDTDTAQFGIENGNTLVVTDIEVDTNYIQDEIEESIRQWFDRNVF